MKSKKEIQKETIKKFYNLLSLVVVYGIILITLVFNVYIFSIVNHSLASEHSYLLLLGNFTSLLFVAYSLGWVDRGLNK